MLVTGQFQRIEVESFLGFKNYHMSFMKDYAKMVVLLQNVMGKKAHQLEMEQQRAFEEFRGHLLQHLCCH